MACLKNTVWLKASLRSQALGRLGLSHSRQRAMFIALGGRDPGRSSLCESIQPHIVPYAASHGCAGAAPGARQSCCPRPAQPSPARGHAAGANTPPCPSKTDRRHGPPPTAKCFPPLFPLTLLSLQMHYWQACKPRWLQPLGEEGDPFPARFNQPHSLPCAALSSASTPSGNVGLQTLPLLSDLGFGP